MKRRRMESSTLKQKNDFDESLRRLTKKRRKLQVDIHGLRQKKKLLITQLENFHKNCVSSSQIEHIKRRIYCDKGELETPNIKFLFKEIAEAARDAKELQTQRERLELQIEHEREYRSFMNSVFNETHNLYNMDITIRTPEIPIKEGPIYSEEVNRLLNNLANIRRDCINSFSSPTSLPGVIDAISAIRESFKAQVSLKTPSINICRGQIETLKSQIRETEYAINKFESENARLREKMFENSQNYQKTITDLVSKNKAIGKEYDEQSNEMDKTITELRAKIEYTANVYDGIVSEMKCYSFVGPESSIESVDLNDMLSEFSMSGFQSDEDLSELYHVRDECRKQLNELIREATQMSQNYHKRVTEASNDIKLRKQYLNELSASF